MNLCSLPSVHYIQGAAKNVALLQRVQVAIPTAAIPTTSYRVSTGSREFDLGGWLHIPRWFTRQQTVTHPGIIIIIT